MPVSSEEDEHEHERNASAEVDEVERKLRLGQHEELIPVLVRAVEAEPLRELRCRQLMVAQYRCGRWDELCEYSSGSGRLWARSGSNPRIRPRNFSTGSWSKRRI